MKVSLTSTDQILQLDGVPCRVWRGETAGGVPFVAFIHKVACQVGFDDEFKHELEAATSPRAVDLTRSEMARMTAGVDVIDLRLIL